MPVSNDPGKHRHTFQLKSLCKPATSPRNQNQLARQGPPPQRIQHQSLSWPASSQQIQEKLEGHTFSHIEACDSNSFNTDHSATIEIHTEGALHHSAKQVSRGEKGTTTMEREPEKEAKGADTAITLRDALVCSLRSPIHRYQIEIDMEVERMGAFRFIEVCNELTRRWPCLPQSVVLAHYFVRQRWQMLGLSGGENRGPRTKNSRRNCRPLRHASNGPPAVNGILRGMG